MSGLTDSTGNDGSGSENGKDEQVHSSEHGFDGARVSHAKGIARQGRGFQGPALFSSSSLPHRRCNVWLVVLVILLVVVAAASTSFALVIAHRCGAAAGTNDTPTSAKHMGIGDLRIPRGISSNIDGNTEISPDPSTSYVFGSNAPSLRPEGPAAVLIAADTASSFPIHPQISTDLAPWVVGGVTALAIRRTLLSNKPSRDLMAVHAVTITAEGFLVFDETDLEAEIDTGLFTKLKLFVEQLNSILFILPPNTIPPVTFLMTSSSLPYLTDMPSDVRTRTAWTKRRAPVFSIAKAHGDGDVLVPNPYFANLTQWEMDYVPLLVRATRHSGPAAWARKLAKLHWRGACSTKLDGVLPRLLMLLTWADYPGFDLAFANECLPRLWSPASIREALTPAQVKAASTLHKRRVEPDELVKFKYLLHLPGASSGSYSRSLQIQLSAGAAVLKFDNPYREFYYSSMIEGYHYLTVNLTNVADVFEWLRDNDAAASALGAAALRFANENLRARHIARYWIQLLREYSTLQRFPIQLPERSCICPGKSALAADRLARFPSISAIKRCRQIPNC